MKTAVKRSSATRTSWFSTACLFAGLSIAVFLALTFVGKLHYYRLPVDQRPFSPDHALLRPSGRLGLVLGIVGTVLLVLNLGYLVRKRLIGCRWLGTLRDWMAFHVLTGLVAGGLILFHSGFAPRSALGILSLSALMITIVTGVVGRYIYARVPRSLEGHELELEDVRKRLLELRTRLLALGIHANWLDLRGRPNEMPRSRGLLGNLLALFYGDRESRQDYRRLRRAVRSTRELRPLRHHILPLARSFCREWQWLVRYHELRTLIGSWRFFHRWLAIVMLIVVMFHVAIALRYGDLWILRGTE